MSASALLPESHFRFLVQAAQEFEIAVVDPEALLDALRDANLAGYVHVHGELSGYDEWALERSQPTAFYEVASLPIDPLEVVKAVRCLQFQVRACPGFETFPAWTWLEVLLDEALSRFPGFPEANGWAWDGAHALFVTSSSPHAA